MTTQAKKAVGKAPAELPPGDQLKDALRGLSGALASRMVSSVSEQVTETASRLSEYAADGQGSLMRAVTGAPKGGTSVRSRASDLVSGLAGTVGQRAGDLLQAARPGHDEPSDETGDKLKATNIIEQIDVGVPLAVAYDQWTRFTDFPGFMKKVENVQQEADEKVRWKAQIFWSHRTWESSILDQVPDERIVWRSTGEKGHVDGAVTFHELAPQLTRIIVVLEYHPQGFMEKTGNLWRAQGRRVRAELRHFQRHVMTQSVLDPPEGWEGEIRDGQVVDQEEERNERERTA